MFNSRVFVLVALVLLAASMPARGQELPFTAQFNFSPPGARALGMGATFIAIADDATAAEANPAGLVILDKPEISVHFRNSTFETQGLDPFTSLTTERTFEEDVSGLSFLSYVHPFKRGALSGYFHQSANYEFSNIFGGTPGNERLKQLDLLQENYGISGGLRLGNNIAIGASLRYSRIDLRLFDSASLFADNLLGRLGLTAHDKDEDITFNAGVLFNANGKYSAGLVYKQGGEFKVQGGGGLDFTIMGTPIFQHFPVLARRFKAPDVYGVGFAYRPTEDWVVGIDILRVTYSDLVGLNIGVIEFPVVIPPNVLSQFQVVFDDETEIHIGAEYSISTGKIPLLLRAGFYTNPDHDGNAAIDSKEEFFTFGGGVWINQRLQVDAALSFSDSTQETVLSFVWSL